MQPADKTVSVACERRGSNIFKISGAVKNTRSLPQKFLPLLVFA